MELCKLGFLAYMLLQDEFVNVLSGIVAAVHGPAAALDARPLGQVSGAEVEFGIRGARGESATAFITCQ